MYQTTVSNDFNNFSLWYSDSMIFDEDDIEPHYIFNPNDDSLWDNRPNASILFNNNNDGLPISNRTSEQDYNNNDDCFSDATPNENGNEIENQNNRKNCLKGEYSYNVFANIKNFWAGPSYWKTSKNRLNQKNYKATDEVNPCKRQAKGELNNKPAFQTQDCDQSSDDDSFLKINSKAAKKMRHCNYKKWIPDKLKLPVQSDFPNNLFDTYAFGPSLNVFDTNQSANATQSNSPEDLADDDFPVSMKNVAINKKNPTQCTIRLRNRS